MIKTSVLYLVACGPITAAGRDFGEVKKIATKHGGAYMSRVLANRSALADASFAFSTDERRQQFIAALTGEGETADE